MKTKFFILVIDRDFIISSGWGRISIYEKRIILKTATNTSQRHSSFCRSGFMDYRLL